MTLQEFVARYDKPNAIVLLEGKRRVLEDDKEKLIALGRLLATKTTNTIFRSGNAFGADEYFSTGVTDIAPKRMQVITPYTDHRKKANTAYETISLDDLQLAAESEVVYQSKGNKKTEKLIDQYISGDKNRFSLKAAYIIRDTIKAIGTATIAPTSFGIFYDDLTNLRSGGTGHTIAVCEHNGIPLVDQRVWFEWLKDNRKKI